MISLVGLDTVKRGKFWQLAVKENHPITASGNRGLVGGSVRIWPHYHEPIRLDPRDPQGPAQVLSFFSFFFLSFLLSLFLSLESSSIVANKSRFFCEQM